MTSYRYLLPIALLTLFIANPTKAAAATAPGHADITIKAGDTPGNFSVSIDVRWLPFDYEFTCEAEIFEDMNVRCLFCEEVDGDKWLALCESTTEKQRRNVYATLLDGNGDEIQGGSGSYSPSSGKGKMNSGETFTINSSGW